MKMRKRYALPGAAAALLIVGGGGLWLFRTPLVTHFVDRTLTQRGVDARYSVEIIGLNHQRLRNLEIGPAGRPDLTARQVDVWLAMGASGPYPVRFEATGVRLRGRWADGRLHLGQIDRLIPAPDGTPFEFPDLRVALADSAARVDTPWGPVAVAIDGRGHLRNAFAGTIALQSPGVRYAGCAAAAVAGTMQVRIARGAPSLDGPLHARSVACPDANIVSGPVRLDLHASVDAAMRAGALRSGVRVINVSAGDAAIANVGGTFAARVDDDRRIDANWRLSGQRFTHPDLQAGTLAIAGSGTFDRQFDGALNAGVAIRRGAVRGRVSDAFGSVGAMRSTAIIGPVAERMGMALERAGRDFAAVAPITVQRSGGAWQASVASARVAAQSGAIVRIAGDPTGVAPLRWAARSGWGYAANISMAGGDLPTATIIARRAGPGEPMRGAFTMLPYGAGDAVIAIAPTQFVQAPGGGTRFVTGVGLSGPLPGGRVDRLIVPLSGTISAGGTVTITGECRPVTFARVALSGMNFDGNRLSLCGRNGGALVGYENGQIRGGLALPRFTLRGRTGTTPLQMTASGAQVDFVDAQFIVRDPDVALGVNGASGRFAAELLTGNYGGARTIGTIGAGRALIGTVPLAMSDINGEWQFADAALNLAARMTVTDTNAPARFEPMRVENAALGYRDGAIRATGLMQAREAGTQVANLSITHQLATGSGHADFTMVPLRFVRGGLQPEAITNLALGVVANVEGQVSGNGRIEWTPQAVTSGGRFRTDAMNLAAAFGPVAGLSGEIIFDDLLALTTPAGQRVALASVNPGIEVIDGVIRYQMLPERRVRIEGGEWPFAGGTLRLQPALMNMADDSERRLTFDVEGVNAGLFLQRYQFDNISATGIFDGVLPTIFDQQGGRIEGGSLVVRDGGGTLAYVGELSNRDLGYVANMAFGALRSLRYDNLAIRMDGRLDGDMVTGVKFAGIGQGEGATNNFLTRQLARLPFAFNIRIRAPFRQLMSSARGLYDPVVLIEQNLPALLRAEREAAAARAAAQAATNQPAGDVQPPVSEDRR